MPKVQFHIVLFVLVWNFTVGQEFTNYTIKDGLPSNRVYRLTQDNEGFIWAITDKGMAKFNGNTFKVFNTQNGLPINDIWDIRVDSQNRIWYFSKTALLGYIKNDLVYRFSGCSTQEVMFPSSTNKYRDTLVFGTGNKWHFFNKNCWEKLDAFEEKPPDAKSFKIVHQKALELVDDPIYRDKTFLRFRNQDSIMVILYNEGFSVVNLYNGTTYPREFKQYAGSLNPNFIRNHFVNGQIQITGFDFVGILNDSYEMDSVVKLPSHLKSYFSMIDKSGNIWCATYSGGIFMLPHVKRQSTYLLDRQKVDQINRVGDKIIANVYNQGFYKYDSVQKNFNPFLVDTSFAFNAIHIDTLKSTFFSSEKKNVQITDHGEIYNNPFGKITGIKNLVYLNRSLYGNVSDGVIEIDTQTFKEKKLYHHYGINDLIVFQKTLFLATTDGLKKLSKDSISLLNLEIDMLKKPILGLLKISDSLLLATTDGYGAYLTDLKTVKLLPESDFLSIESAYASENKIWLASDKGILLYEKNNREYQYVNTINENDGLPSKKVNSIIKVRNDLLVSTDDGVVILPVDLKKNKQLLKVYIENIRYNQKPIEPTEPSVYYTANNSFDISVASINYSINQNHSKYFYRLLPYQKNWIQTASSHLNFSNLKPGSYTLEIKAEDLINTTRFTILPLWWQRPITKISFWLAGLLLAGWVLYYFRNREIRRKTAKLRAQKKLAEYELYALRTQMNPHFVFNSLAAIQYYINNNDFETSEKYLVKFSKLIRQYFELSKVSEITLNSEIKLLKNYLDIEKLRFKEKLEYTFNMDIELDVEKVTIPTMLLQPIVENAVNHGIFNKETNGRIDLNFTKKKNNTILVEIKDDGVGFSNVKKKKNGKVNSSAVLENRIAVLNRSKQWEITHYNTPAYPKKRDVGNRSILNIKKIQ